MFNRLLGLFREPVRPIDTWEGLSIQIDRKPLSIDDGDWEPYVLADLVLTVGSSYCQTYLNAVDELKNTLGKDKLPRAEIWRHPETKEYVFLKWLSIDADHYCGHTPFTSRWTEAIHELAKLENSLDESAKAVLLRRTRYLLRDSVEVYRTLKQLTK